MIITQGLRKGLSIIIMVAAIFALGIFFFVRYRLQPCHIEGADKIVDQATIEVFGLEYNGQQTVTRQDTLYIISKVFYSLKQPGFNDVETLTQAIGQAVDSKLLQGNGVSPNLEGRVTNQETLVFISRGLRLPLNGTETVSLPFKDARSISDWALPYIKALTVEHYLDWVGTGALMPNGYTTIYEIRIILNHLVSKVTAPQSFLDFLQFEFKHNPVIVFISIVFTLFVSFALPVCNLISSISKERKHNLNIHGTICMAGNTGVGKTTLIAKMRNPSAPVIGLKGQKPPTRGIHTEPIRLIAGNGDVIFDGTIKDMSGEYSAGAIQFLAGAGSNKVLLLVLAHTKNFEGTQIDDKFIDEQFDTIKLTWVPSLQAHGHLLKKLIVFINKTDLISHESGDIQEHVYKRHIDLLMCTVNSMIPIHVIEGSSVKGTGLQELYRAFQSDI